MRPLSVDIMHTDLSDGYCSEAHTLVTEIKPLLCKWAARAADLERQLEENLAELERQLADQKERADSYKNAFALEKKWRIDLLEELVRTDAEIERLRANTMTSEEYRGG